MVPFLQTHFLASVEVQYFLFLTFFLNCETTNQFFLKGAGFWSNAACLMHLIFSGIKLLNGQGTVLCVKWLFCQCRAVVDKEIMGKYLYQNSCLKYSSIAPSILV